MTYSRILGTAAFALFTFTHPLSAQSLDMNSPAGAVEIVTGVMDYDLQGTGRTMPLTVRAIRPLTGGLSLELGSTFARPSQTFGTSTFVAPEARLQYAWRFGRVRPFVAGGGGVSATNADLTGTRWRMTLLAGGGARVDLTDRVYALGEMRLRGLTRRFSASTGEFLGGIGVTF